MELIVLTILLIVGSYWIVLGYTYINGFLGGLKHPPTHDLFSAKLKHWCYITEGCSFVLLSLALLTEWFIVFNKTVITASIVMIVVAFWVYLYVSLKSIEKIFDSE